MAWNLAALMASDEGEHQLARTLCLQHFDIQQRRLRDGDVDAFPLGLQPLVNLVRLANNAGDHNLALEQLAIVQAYAHGARGLHLAGRHLEHPRHLPAQVRGKAVDLLAGVAATDGVRARIGASLWSALADDTTLEQREPGDIAHQVRTVAYLAVHRRDTSAGVDPGRQTTPADVDLSPWTQCVLALLNNAATTLAGDRHPGPAKASHEGPSMTADAAYAALGWMPGTEVAHTRLALDLLRFGAVADLARVCDDIVDRALRGQDAYVCRDLLEDGELLALGAATRRALQYVVTSACHDGQVPLIGVLTDALSGTEPGDGRLTRSAAETEAADMEVEAR